jgi:hypothetical protein
MWDDEDNNPYGSFARHDSNASDVPGLASPTQRKTAMRYPEQHHGRELMFPKCRIDPRRRRPRHRPPHKTRPSLYRTGT